QKFFATLLIFATNRGERNPVGRSNHRHGISFRLPFVKDGPRLRASNRIAARQSSIGSDFRNGPNTSTESLLAELPMLNISGRDKPVSWGLARGSRQEQASGVSA